MIIIHYPKHNSTVSFWKSQLEALVTSHQLIENTELEQPTLKDNSTNVEGEAAISQYIDDLMQFRDTWFSCACQ